MKLTLRWLAEFVDLPTSDPAEIAAAFERLGHQVDGYQPLVADFERVVIGQVIAVAAHPNADRLRVCTVDAGDAAGVADIVCGAWNFEADAVVPVALPGARVGELAVVRRTIRTVVSNGMICSERELGLGDDHTGIMVLDADFPEAGERIGADFATLLDMPDVVFDLTITPNRPDCMSVLGLARELGALFRVEVRQPVVTVAEEPPVATTAISIADPVGCPRFVGRELRHVTVGSSPLWIRLRLRAAGIRPINNVVDASNYAMVELGHPTHAFDLDRLGDTVVVRRAAAGERLVTLDDQDRALHEVDMVVADADRPVAIAGVMGGAGTEIGDDSTRILIEAAYWDPPSILVTSRRLGLRSEASARFERGMDPNFCHVAADRVAQLLQQTAGAAVVANRIDVYPLPIDPVVVTLGSDDIERHLGISLGLDTAAELLRRLGCDVAPGDPLVVTVPTRRRDIERTIDLVEEVARLHGFDGIPDRVRTGRGGALPAEERNRRRLRRFMAGAGYYETAALSFIGASDLDALDLPDDDGRRNGIAVVNPLHDGQGVMRTTLLPGLIAAAASNVSHRIDDVALFETGLVFLPGPADLPEQPEHLGFIRVGTVGTDLATPGRPVDVRDATGLWEALAMAMGVTGAAVRQGEAPELHPGRSAEVLVDGDVIGVVGELHPTVADRAGLPGRVVIGEIAMAPLIADRPSWRLEPPSPFPPNIFDLAFEIERTTPVGDLLEAIAAGAGDLFESLRVFDVFTGGPVAAGRRSIAVRLTLRAPDHTLTDHELTPVRRHIVATVVAATGATLRGEV
ncbi:MAG: phenylalanine--tRNA ligase subunit beta [Acidimicrobiia bacterium]|nr:phenylalanine--tRNA ligase subunit beta [Acidimicrobiia bacterium]